MKLPSCYVIVALFIQIIREVESVSDVRGTDQFSHMLFLSDEKHGIIVWSQSNRSATLLISVLLQSTSPVKRNEPTTATFYWNFPCFSYRFLSHSPLSLFLVLFLTVKWHGWVQRCYDCLKMCLCHALFIAAIQRQLFGFSFFF